MTRLAALDNKKHRNTTISTDNSAYANDTTHVVQICLPELHATVLEFPVFFTKSNETGEFHMVAIMGLEQNQNLYIQDGQWQTNYIPLNFTRRPFVVGVHTDTNEQGEQTRRSIITIDEHDPRVNSTNGHRLFDDQGEPTEILNQKNEILATLAQGIDVTNALIKNLLADNLLEPVQLNITLANKEESALGGLYAVQQKTLNALPAEKIAELNSNGTLEVLHLIKLSTRHLNQLAVKASHN